MSDLVKSLSTVVLATMVLAGLFPSICAGDTSVTATRITNRSAPVIDGVLEDIWNVAGFLPIPNAHTSCFTLGTQNYYQTDPSTYDVRFLHDDINLYIAIQTTDDTMVESAAYDLNSDGLAGLALERRDGGVSLFRLVWYGGDECGPPVARDRMSFDAEWRFVLDPGRGYTIEFSIPLADPASGGSQGLGGWQPGETLLANLVIVDHDSHPGGASDDPVTDFRICRWGAEQSESLSIPREIHLSAAPPIGLDGDQTSVKALHIDTAMAPIIDGNPDEEIWQSAETLRFPNVVGKTFSLSKTCYNADDPSEYEVAFLHDDSHLFVAVQAWDRKIEAAAYDQDSDGLISLVFETRGGSSDQRYASFWSELDLWENHNVADPIEDCDGSQNTNVDFHFQQGPPLHPYDTSNVAWAPTLTGTLNDNTDTDSGYTVEIAIPLNRLGGYVAGELIPTNIVFTDHDDHPGGAFDDAATRYRKAWWGFDGNEFYPPGGSGRRIIPPEEERFVLLDEGPAVCLDCGDPPDGDPAQWAADYIAGHQLEYSGLIRSFPDDMAAHLYDQAVALLALLGAGRETEARRLAGALVALQEIDGDEGFFYDAYNVVDGRVGQGTASGTGPNTWTALALDLFGRTFDDPPALEAAKRVKLWVERRLFDADDGGVYGGFCHPFEERDDHSGDLRFPFKSTEQVIDSWHLFRALGDLSRATNVLSWLFTPGAGWVDVDPGCEECRQEQRFSTGWNEACGPDSRLFLDPQSWGSIVASIVGDPVRAWSAIQAAEQHLKITMDIDSETITGFMDSCLPKDGIIWNGGSCQMVVAHVYHGDLAAAAELMEEMARVQNADGSWNHSLGDSLTTQDCGECQFYESFHSAKPHLGETSWCLFAWLDVAGDLRLPYEIPNLESRIIFSDGFESGDVCRWTTPVCP